MAAPPAFDALFAQSRDLLCEGFCASLATILGGADASITEALDKATDQELKKIMMEARDLARTQRPTIEKQFREKYTTEVRKATNKAKKIAASLADISLGELSLVDDDDLNETLKYNAVAAKIKRKCEEELSAIEQRVRVLLDQPTLESDENPFSAEILCDAFKHACRQAGGSVQARLVLLRLFEDEMPEAAAESYQKVNDLRVANQILPKIKYGITTSKSDPAKRAAAADKAGGGDKDKPGESAPAEPEDEGDIFARIQKMLAPIAGQGPPPAPGMGVGGIPIMQGADLSGALTNIQRGDFTGVTGPEGVDLSAVFAAASSMTNVLKELKSSNVGQSMGQVDAMTLDIVSMLFDELFDDAKVPIALKGIIGRLQLPMLKVALKDKDLFSTKTHPARKFLDTLGQIGYRLPADFDDASPLFKRLEGFIQEIVDGFQDNVEIFDTVRLQLEEIIAEYDHKVVEEMKAEQTHLERAEKLALAKAVAEHEITRRVEGSSAPRPVVEFLAQQWIKYLIILYAREGGESEGYKAALATVDQLLWSIEPKTSVEDRRKLASSIPGILKGVRAGVAGAGINQEACTAFFGELMKCHTEVMQAQPKAKEAHVKGKVAVTAGGEVARKPAPPPGERPEDLLDFTQPVVMDNPFGEGQVQVVSEDLDFTAAAAAPAALEPAAPEAQASAPARPKRARETTIPLPARLVEGTWVEILDESDRKQAARLHYVSPMKSHFLFVDRKGNKVYECSRSMLARRLNNLEIAILDGEPDASLFDRIMESLFGKLGTAAPAPAG
jgi:exonuclease VII small subunit